MSAIPSVENQYDSQGDLPASALPDSRICLGSQGLGKALFSGSAKMECSESEICGENDQQSSL
jgi:hypothetical protein